MAYDPYSQHTDAYQESFTQLYLADSDYEELDISLDDDQLCKMLNTALEQDRDYWNKAPWRLQDTDTTNVAFLLGDQIDDSQILKNIDNQYIDNRLFSSTRAILSYATGQLAKPDITPSKGDEIYLKGARDIGAGLYQHSLEEKAEYKVRAAVMNLISRKRAYLKLRYNPNKGLDGDIVTEMCPPDDIIISRFARYLDNPDKIHHRIRCTIDELVAKFPEKKQEIFTAFSIIRGLRTQTSRVVTYFETWFTHTTTEGKPAESVAWWIPEKRVMLGKLRNPNWIYYASRKKEFEANVTQMPPKPFISFNYMNLGKSFIDETCLIEQALPMQKMLNKRGQQIWNNADYVNGRWLASKKAFSEEDAHKLVNKGPRTVALVDREDVTNALVNVASDPLPSYVENTMYDARNEIDEMMGTPAVFKGAQPDKKDTLGRDLMVKQQAGALQDDLVRCISDSMAEYYKLKLQLMRVYYNEDHWFQTKGADGKYEFILLNGTEIDTNVKVNVQVDSTLPLDKAQQRATAMELWNAGNAIDIKSLYEFLGMPNPEVLAERYLKSNTDPVGYLQSVQQTDIDTDAESDIMLLIANRVPEERDDYTQSYFDYINKFMASNRFQKLQGSNPKAAERVTMFFMAIQDVMLKSAELQALAQPPPEPMIDPETGLPVEPQIDPATGQPLPPEAQAATPQMTPAISSLPQPPLAPPVPPVV